MGQHHALGDAGGPRGEGEGGLENKFFKLIFARNLGTYIINYLFMLELGKNLPGHCQRQFALETARLKQKIPVQYVFICWDFIMCVYRSPLPKASPAIKLRIPGSSGAPWRRWRWPSGEVLERKELLLILLFFLLFPP